MNDKLEKTLKELIPYIIVTGILFLLLPIFMGKSAGFMTYLIELVAFPLTALGCGIVYKIKKKRNNLFLCLIAPIFYALSALLYGMWRASWYTVLIYSLLNVSAESARKRSPQSATGRIRKKKPPDPRAE